MNNTDFRALCAELLEELDWHFSWHDAKDLKARARAALAKPYSDPAEERRLGYLQALADVGKAALAVPVAADSDVIRALVKAEAALADIGDAEREPGDDLAWCERRAAEALPFVRDILASAAELENAS